MQNSEVLTKQRAKQPLREENQKVPEIRTVNCQKNIKNIKHSLSPGKGSLKLYSKSSYSSKMIGLLRKQQQSQ